MQDFDLVVVGAGVAGLTAAMFGGRYGLKVGIVDQMGSGGQIINAEKIENFPGFPEGLAGYDLGPLIQEQAENAGAEFMMDTVESLETVDGLHVLGCAEDSLRAPTVIIAAGSALRPLGVPGEAELTGRGVSHCATCDGPFFQGKPVCVIGGGDSAVDEALVLTEYASQVTVFHRGESLGAQQALLDRVAAAPSVEVALRSQVDEIVGEDGVTGVRVRDLASDATRVQELSGVFVYVGLEPNTAFLRGVLSLDATGHIETDIMMQTSLPGVFAAGDIRKSSVAQLVAAAGDGATAAIAAYRYLRARE
jgi:thioredoxin reductase (NADPH)